MGKYIQTSSHMGKAREICEKYGGKECSLAEAQDALFFETHDVVCVVNNFAFEAAGWAYNSNELAAFSRPDDDRPKTYLLLPRNTASALVS